MHSFDLDIRYEDASKETAEVFVTGKIQGEDRQFLLDTGCSKSSLCFDEFSARFERAGAELSSGVFGRTGYDLISVGSVELGPIVKNDVVIRRAQAGQLDRNLFGMDLLKGYRLIFYFERGRVEVDPHPFDENSAMQELMVSGGFIPYVNLTCGDTATRAVWDTGASITLADTSFIAKNAGLFNQIGRDVGTDSTGSQMETPIYRMDSVVIGGKEFPPAKVVGVDLSHVNASTDLSFDFILGFSTLRNADWLFDFPQRKWAILRK